MCVQRIGGMHAEIVLHGEHPRHHLVAAVTAVEQYLDQTVEVFDDAELVEEHGGDRGLTAAGDGEQMMVPDQRPYPVGRHPQSAGDIVDRQHVEIGRETVLRQR